MNMPALIVALHLIVCLVLPCSCKMPLLNLTSDAEQTLAEEVVFFSPQRAIAMQLQVYTAEFAQQSFLPVSNMYAG